MAKMNYNRPNAGYERESWRRPDNTEYWCRADNKPKRLSKGSNKKTQSKKDLVRLMYTFMSGKYQGQPVEHIVKKDPNYIIWVLENHPKGIIAEQVVAYFNKKSDIRTK